VFREQMVRAWPPTASAYAAIGLPVNPTGLVIENVQMEPSLEEGHPTLVVSGSIRNVVGRGVLAPPLRISLLNAQGRRVAGQITDWTDRHVPPGSIRHFRTSIPDPPFSAASLQIDFAIGGRATAGDAQVSTTAQPPPTNIPLRGPAAAPAPVNATPLPPEPASAPAPAPAATNGVAAR
jgi:hypothetical protein